MIHLARFSIRRPVVALLAWGAVALVLTLIGLGASGTFSPTVTTVPGTESSRAQHLAADRFGPSVLVPILLEGPARQLDRQGPALVRSLAARRDVRVLSAWDTGTAAAQLRPSRNQAVIVASVAQTEKQMVSSGQRQIERIVDRQVSFPVKAAVSGQASIDRAMKDHAIDATRRNIALTLPILFLVLLLLLRAPVAALLITALGAGTAFSGLGLTALSGKVFDVDAIAVMLGTMTALILGVGYGLLFFRQWRDVYDADATEHDAAHAATEALQSAGRAVLIGGTALIVARLAADVLGPTKVLASLGTDSLVCAMLAVGAAVVVMPAALVLLGRRVEWASFAAPAFMVRAWDRLAGQGETVIRHAVPVGAAATALLAVMAIPLLSLDTGPPSAKYLPSGDSARQAYERLATVMGPGWPTPYNVVLVSKNKPITDPALLAKVDDFQGALAGDPRIDSIVGPGELAATSRQLGVLPTKLQESTKLLKGGKKDLGRLERGLGQAGAGVKTLRAGLAQAAGGSGQAQGGAGQLKAGLDKARNGAAQISGGLAAALTGARQLRDGASKALSGSQQITGGLGQAVKPVKAGAPIVKTMAGDVSASSDAVKGAQGSAQALTVQLDQASAAIDGLPDSAAKSDAAGAVASARQAAGGLESSLTSTSTKLAGAAGIAGAFSNQVQQLSSGLSQLFAGSTELTTGIDQLRKGNGDLAKGIAKLSGGGGQLTTGLTALRDGAGQLETGLGQLTGGLSGGVGQSAPLVSGLGLAESKVSKFRGDLPSPKELEQLQRESPGLFDSGYFVLAAVAGAKPAARNQASLVVNVPRGGDAGQITVISRYAAEDPRSQQFGKDLVSRADGFAAANGMQAAVGGPAGSLSDFRSESASRIWPVVAGVSIIVALLLMALLQTVLLPLAAVAFDLLVAAATFGVMTTLFNGSDAPLGGPGYLDPVSIIAVFASIFGVSMVYQAQLLSRTRDHFVETGDPEGALRTGLSDTAAATTGVAVAMMAALIPFALGDLLISKQIGVGVATAILLNAIIVRPVLLPAAVAVLGRRGWWPTKPAAKQPPPSEPEPLPEHPLVGVAS